MALGIHEFSGIIFLQLSIMLTFSSIFRLRGCFLALKELICNMYRRNMQRYSNLVAFGAHKNALLQIQFTCFSVFFWCFCVYTIISAKQI